MVIFLQEDHELPLIDGTARIRGGSVNEPADKTGLIDIYSEVWRTGGTKTQTGDQLDDFLEVRAAKVETGGRSRLDHRSASPASRQISTTSSKSSSTCCRIPNSAPTKSTSRRKKKTTASPAATTRSARSRSANPIKLAYGSDNPYARVPEYATVAAITRQDLIDWHGKYVHPNNIILGISGDFDSAAMEARLRAAFDVVAQRSDVPKNEIQYDPAKPGYYLVPKDDVNQSNIHMVALGTTRDNPDYYAISVFNEAFGGGFSSRLFNDIRTKRGTGLRRRRRHRHQLRPSRHSAGLNGHQEPEHDRSDSGRRRRHRQSDQAAHHRRRDSARQRRHPQRVHLPSRLARQDSRRAHDLRVLRISSRLARQVPGGNQEGHGSRRQPRRRQVSAQGSTRGAGRRQHQRFRQAAVIARRGKGNRHHDSASSRRKGRQGRHRQARRLQPRRQSAGRKSRRRHGRPAQTDSRSKQCT